MPWRAVPRRRSSPRQSSARPSPLRPASPEAENSYRKGREGGREGGRAPTHLAVEGEDVEVSLEGGVVCAFHVHEAPLLVYAADGLHDPRALSEGVEEVRRAWEGRERGREGGREGGRESKYQILD